MKERIKKKKICLLVSVGIILALTITLIVLSNKKQEIPQNNSKLTSDNQWKILLNNLSNESVKIKKTILLLEAQKNDEKNELNN